MWEDSRYSGESIPMKRTEDQLEIAGCSVTFLRSGFPGQVKIGRTLTIRVADSGAGQSHQ